MDARLKYLATPDKIKLYSEFWVPDEPKAIVVFVHGVGDHLGRYAQFMRHMIAKGFGVCLYDQRGHGRSEGRRTHCRSFSDFLRDLSMVIDMVQEAYPNAPVYLAGHSFGGQLVLNFVTRFSKGLRGFIVLSPNIEPIIKVPAWKIRLLKWCSRWIPVKRYVSIVTPRMLSHDEKVVTQAMTDPLMNFTLTARMAGEMLRNCAAIPKLAFKVKIPCLFLHGSSDRVCSIEATRRFFHGILIQNKEMKTYQGYAHELLNEKDREKVFTDIETWLNAQVFAFKRLASNPNGEHYASKDSLDVWRYSRDFSHGGA